MDDAAKAEVLEEMISDSQRKLEKVRGQLELEERYLEHLKHRRSALVNGERNLAVESASPRRRASRSLPEAIKAALQASGRPMRAKDIARQLVQNGYTSKAKHGLLPSVLSALGRRGDLFEKTARGIYRARQLENAQE